MGGSDPATATAEVIDLNAPNPTWRYVAPMASPRKQHVATILPNGKVLVIGGHSGPGKDNPAYPVYPAELWDPVTETWTTLASMATYRGYHSTAFVLPDGRVVSAGGEDVGANAEIFSPPYLFWGPRPTITSAPATVSLRPDLHGDHPRRGEHRRVTLLRLPSVTHGFDQNQRFAELSFTAGDGRVERDGPEQPEPGSRRALHDVPAQPGGRAVGRQDHPHRRASAPPPRPRPRPPPTTTTTTPRRRRRTTPTTTTAHRSIPPAPTGLTATSPQGSRRVNLRWTDTSSLETGLPHRALGERHHLRSDRHGGTERDHLLEHEPDRGDEVLVPGQGLQRDRRLAAVQRRQHPGPVAIMRRTS